MAPEWIYLLKVNVGITLFYAFYKLFCQRDTFFQWRRFALLSFLAISFIYPLQNIQHWIKEQPAMYELADYYATLIITDEVNITSTPVPVEVPSLMIICKYIYALGILCLTIRFIIQLISILRMRKIGKEVYIHGKRIISLPFETNPFSFGRWIFLYLPQLERDNLDEILMHEQTHVRQWHSLDIIISEIINIICWFNPFMWLLKTEIRLSLEYLADNKVTETLDNSKQYQYHLLGLANTNRKTGLYNNFNVSHLKRRIIMMNKKRTHMTGRIKYSLFALLAIALLLVSNIETVARSTKQSVEEVTVAQVSLQQDTVYTVVEEMPMFPGGMGELMKFINSNVKYPPEAIKKKTQGRVVVAFIVEKDGSISNPSIAKSVDPLLDTEALRVIKSIPKWIPGKLKGQTVRVKYTLPVQYRLQ